MPSLNWAIHWEWGVYTIDADMEAILIQAIRQRILGKQIKASDVGLSLEGLTIRLQNTNVVFSAQLERIDPLMTFTVSLDTNMNVRLAATFDTSSPASSGHGSNSSSLGTELDDFVMWQVAFNPSEQDGHYIKIYESLVGIDKGVILEEMVSLLSPVEIKEQWSFQHYQALLPIIRATATKAPVIVFGGDPGTGKTALATSIGAPLAKRIGERVHFRH